MDIFYLGRVVFVFPDLHDAAGKMKQILQTCRLYKPRSNFQEKFLVEGYVEIQVILLDFVSDFRAQKLRDFCLENFRLLRGAVLTFGCFPLLFSKQKVQKVVVVITD